MKKDTSWGKVAGWYAEHLNDPESYHSRVILPNLLRLMDVKKGDKVLDLACGTGFFSKAFSEAGAAVIGVDIGRELIEHAKKQVPRAHFFVSPAHILTGIASQSIDKISLVLAIQNIKEIREMLTECARVLVPAGKLYIVMNHPAFRIPKGSSWEWDKENKQYRKIDHYLSEKTISIDMQPGKKKAGKNAETVSFHRPLQYYFKLLSNAGFSVTRLEEWISHKSSEKGPRQKEEDRMRKEIPLFLFMEVRRP
jgi:ubiquinone/menaquinone biosynthesis C-methylase UbiE